jgi:hypothetical protein
MEVAERFWSKVDKSAGPEACWPWMGGMSGRYGKYYPAGRHSGELAHRYALMVATGPPQPEAPHALHSCDNPPCCNPAHLHWGTHQQNMQEAADRGRMFCPRASKAECAQGHAMTGANVMLGERSHPRTGKRYQIRKCRQCNINYLARRRAARRKVA